MYLRVEFLELLAPLRSQIQCTLLLEAAGTSATDDGNKFCWTVHRTSFPWKPILAAYAEPYGSSKTVATTGYTAPVPGVVPT